MTIATLLRKMRVLDNELDIDAGGADETRAIDALDMAQDAFEGVIANVPDLLGTKSDVLIASTANGESTAWPATLVRLDTLYLLDASSRQRWEVKVIHKTGGHAPIALPFSATAVQSSGAPREAYTNRADLYWSPIPDTIYAFRAYGLFSKADITARTETFAYPDLISLPMAAYAVRLMEMGIDDPSEELKALAEETFNPAIKALGRPTRQGAEGRVYSEVHTT
jgi:hypothetical protein